MLRGSKKLSRLVTAGVLSLAVPLAAASLSNPVFHILATNASGTAEYSVPDSALVYNAGLQAWQWSSAGSVTLTDQSNNEDIARLAQAAITLRDFGTATRSRQISMTYALEAGTSLTTFTVESSLLSFPIVPDSLAMGKASFAAGVTDQNGDGATLHAVGPNGNGMYTAAYNGFGHAGSVFSNLINSVYAGPGGSNNASANDPASGYRPVGAAVYDMSAVLDFTLTAGDLTSASTGFYIAPEPTSAGLLGLVLVALLRRR